VHRRASTSLADAEIRHAVRNATRLVVMDDELTLLIGPSTEGSMLESLCSTSTVTTPS